MKTVKFKGHVWAIQPGTKYISINPNGNVWVWKEMPLVLGGFYAGSGGTLLGRGEFDGEEHLMGINHGHLQSVAE